MLWAPSPLQHCLYLLWYQWYQLQKILQAPHRRPLVALMLQVSVDCDVGFFLFFILGICLIVMPSELLESLNQYFLHVCTGHLLDAQYAAVAH